jgi:hypothetical protein
MLLGGFGTLWSVLTICVMKGKASGKRERKLCSVGCHVDLVIRKRDLLYVIAGMVNSCGLVAEDQSFEDTPR